MIYSIDKKESNRITCLRAMCVVLVIFLHQYAGDLGNGAFVASGTIPNNAVLQGIQYIISRIVTFSAVPLFFMLSSVLLYAKEFTWKSNMKKKLKSLVLPYVLWITLYILMYFIGQTLPMTAGFFANAGRKVSEMTVWDFIGAYTGIGGHGLFVNAMWFLRDLILLNMLAPVMKKLIDRSPLLCLILLAILWNMGTIPEILVLGKQSIVFFSLGYYVVKYNARMKQVDSLPYGGLALEYVLTIVLEYYFHTIGSTLATAAHSFTVIIGIALLIKVSGTFCKGEESEAPLILQIIAKYSFFVYVSQDFVQTVLKKLTTKVLPQTDAVQMIEYVMIPILVCIICISAAAILQKLMPPVYSILTGARKQTREA